MNDKKIIEEITEMLNKNVNAPTFEELLNIDIKTERDVEILKMVNTKVNDMMMYIIQPNEMYIDLVREMKTVGEMLYMIQCIGAQIMLRLR